MREFDQNLLSILRTETKMEHLLRTDDEERDRFVRIISRGGDDQRFNHELEHNVSITRLLRFVPSMPRVTGKYLEMTYVVSGGAVFTAGDEKVELHKGDVFIPNQYVPLSWDALGEDDILINYVMNFRFLEDAVSQLHANTMLYQFLVDALKKGNYEKKYLHFVHTEDPSIINLAETMAFAAFPFLNDQNISRGEAPNPQITEMLMTVMFASLAMNMDHLDKEVPIGYDELMKERIGTYLDREYRTASLTELAQQIHLSESALSRQVKRMYNMNFKDLLMNKRFERAIKLMKTTNISLADIAYVVGYKNTTFFYNRFREIYGCSPKDYREKLRESDE